MNRSRRRGGRDVTALMRQTIDSQLPPIGPLADAPAPEGWGTQLAASLSDGRGRKVAARGRRHPGHGWTGLGAPLPVYRASTAQACGLFPWVAAEPTPPVGAWIGPDYLSGAGFFVHPSEWLAAGRVTNPNLILFGEPGRGKSALIKTMAWRLSAFGVKTFVVGDTKGEYNDLVAAMGCAPISLGLGFGARLNPLDDAAESASTAGLTGAQIVERLTVSRSRRLVLLRALLAAGRYEVTASDEATLAAVLADLTGQARGDTQLKAPTIPQAHHALAYPSAELATTRRCANPAELAERSRAMTDALGAMVNGALAGLFDEPTNVNVDFGAPIQSVNLRGLSGRGEEAIAVALLCMGSWAQAAQAAREPGQRTLVVRDEMWRVMRLGPEFVSAVDSQLRLSRSEGEFHVLAAHKPSDMLTVGDAGSKAVHIARDLLALCDTRVLLGQSAGVTADLADSIGLTDREQDELTGWANGMRGRSIWKVGRHTHKVRAWLTPAEQVMFNTDEAMVDTAVKPSAVDRS